MKEKQKKIYEKEMKTKLKKWNHIQIKYESNLEWKWNQINKQNDDDTRRYTITPIERQKKNFFFWSSDN